MSAPPILESAPSRQASPRWVWWLLAVWLTGTVWVVFDWQRADVLAGYVCTSPVASNNTR